MQHKEDIRLQSGKTALSSRAHNVIHGLDFDCAKVLDREENVKKREHMESLYIIKNNNITMNLKTDVGTKGLLHTNILTKAQK